MEVESNTTGVPSSSVAWPAIISGAFAAASISLILLILGNGLGLASVSPWGNNPLPATFTIMTAIWLIFMQWVSSGIGGYITGRLRNRFARMHSDEVFFRDTAHGLLTWALATLCTAAFLASLVSSVISGGVNIATTVRDTEAVSPYIDNANIISDYEIDKLFRSDSVGDLRAKKLVRNETINILNTNMKRKNFSEDDKTYLTSLVVAYSDISEAEAYVRVNALIAQTEEAKTKAKKVADKARKAGSSLAIFTALSMIIGAFIACAAAALGGKHRDEY